MEFILDNLKTDENFAFDIFNYKYNENDGMEFFHYHNYFEMTLVLDGKIQYYIGDKEIVAKASDIVITNNLEPHKVVTFSNTAEIYVMIFYPNFIWNGTNIVDYNYIENFFSSENNFDNFISKSLFYAPQIEILIREIYFEYITKQDGYKLMIKAKLLSILTLLYRNHKLKKANTKISSLKKLDNIINYIDKNFDKELTLKNCSELCKLSEEYFSKLFKDTFLINFNAYITKVRIANSMKLLKNTSLSVKEIAKLSGFKTFQNYTKSFYKINGTTSNKFRKKETRN